MHTQCALPYQPCRVVDLRPEIWLGVARCSRSVPNAASTLARETRVGAGRIYIFWVSGSFSIWPITGRFRVQSGFLTVGKLPLGI